MKKLLSTVFVLMCISGFSQIYTPTIPSSYGSNNNRIKANIVLHLPVASDTLLNTNDTSAQIRVNNGQLQYHYGIWRTVVGSNFFDSGHFVNIYDNQSVGGNKTWLHDQTFLSTPTIRNSFLAFQTTNFFPSRYTFIHQAQPLSGTSVNVYLPNTSGILIRSVNNTSPDSTGNVTVSTGSSFDTSTLNLVTRLGEKENLITSGTTAQYWRGDKTWQNFNTAARGAISLTTTGSSGAATYSTSTGVLNIPQYTTGITSETDPLSVHIADSANMLLPYLRKAQANANYIDTSHTALGLATYNEALFLYNRHTDNIALKKNIVDSFHNVADHYVRQDRMKNYVDSVRGTLLAPTLQQVTDAGATTTNELTIQGARIGASGGSANLLFGVDAALSNTGTCTAIGGGAGQNNSGGDCVFLGKGAGSGNAGNRVVAIGVSSGSGNSFTDVNLIGQAAAATSTDQTVFGNPTNSIVINHAVQTGADDSNYLHVNIGAVDYWAPLYTGSNYIIPLTLTTTGTSGAASLSGNILNIPQYSGGSGTVTSVTAGYGITGGTITTTGTIKADTSVIQKKLSAGTGIAISGNTIYNTSTATGTVTSVATNTGTGITGGTITGTGTIAADTTNVLETIASRNKLSDSVKANIAINTTSIALKINKADSGWYDPEHYLPQGRYVVNRDSNNAVLNASIALKANIASPTFTGTVTIPTPFTLGATSVTATGTEINNLSGVTGTTGTGNLVLATQPTFGTSIRTPLIIGGTTTTSALTLRTTTNSGATGADIICQSGSNGATEIMRMKNDGSVGIGSSTTTDYLNITGASFAATGRSGITVQNTTNTGSATFYFQNNRGSFASYGGVVHGGSTNVSTFFGLARGDRSFFIHDGASGLGMGIGTLIAQPVVFGTNNAENMRIVSGGDILINTTTDAPSALLNVTSTSKGVLLPRMTKTQRDAISSPATGLEIFQTDNIPGKRVFNGTNWMRYTETID